MMKKLTSAIILLNIVLISCSEGLTKHGELFSQFMITDEGLFRGLELGSPVERVLQSEKTAPLKKNEKLLVYSGELGKSGIYTIKYGFEETLLSEILVDAEFSDKPEGIELLKGFSSYFNERFGLSIKDGGYLVWKGNTEDNQNSVIEMNDESEFNDYGQLILSFYIQPTSE